jgi:hypothetical protein
VIVMPTNTRPPEFICKVPDGEEVVGIVSTKTDVFVATTKAVYRLVEKTLIPVAWEILP